jgi:hypothetical protein
VKINYKNTALHLLDHIDHLSFRIIDDGGETTADQKMMLAHSIITKWPNLQPRFSKKIQYISHPFYEAYDKSCHKLGAVLDAEPINESGTFIFKPDIHETNTIFYSIETWGQKNEFEMDATILFFNNHTKKDKTALGLVAQRRPGMPASGARFYASKKAIDAGLEPISIFGDIFTMILFMKYCELDTKLIKANRKDHHIGIKYVNETKRNIEILDSTWFTTLVKSEGFGVRGHFRFQPYGPNNSLRKLIWIDAFEKEGYTRQAKVLNQPNNENNDN